MSKYTDGKKVIEDRKGYNKSYYSQNKQQLLKTARKKECCPQCGRSVSHVNMRRHQQTKLCKKRQKEQEEDEAEFDRIEQLEAEAEAKYFEEKEEEYHKKMEEQQKMEEHQQLNNCYIMESDDEEDIQINDIKWELNEEKPQEEPENIKKLRDSLKQFFQKMEDLENKRKDNKITDEEYGFIFQGLIQQQANFKY